ncbi:hypothetical protein OG723_44470 (plasmid) [Streptomyces sp. NBC_01278]|uniref:hypothetical protein n=1 Tax=Streptomyces sp. NBC_01278 TaxID=2903809 RepID=UPI002E375D81|nr:hypothetical protein [Streptomyces sp. NBC_01278]
MYKTVEDLSAAALASLTGPGFTAARVHRHSDTSVIVTVPADRRTWAEFALMSFTALPLSDHDGQARIALFTEPEDTAPTSAPSTSARPVRDWPPSTSTGSWPSPYS